MVWAAASMLIVSGVIVAASHRLKAVDQMASAEFSADGQARQVAEASLVDAFAWFRRQQVQPVVSFAPARNLSANPLVNETDDPTVGLVRTFEVSPGWWARYEVKKSVAAEAYVDANANGHYDKGETFSDANQDRKWSPARETRDVTAQRGLPGAGAVWQIVGHSRMFRRPRIDLPLGTGPNTQVAEATLAAEIRRLTLAPPAAAAICLSKANPSKINGRARVRSDATVVAYGVNNGTLDTVGGELQGPTTTALVPSWKDDVDSVFGVDWISLKSMADISTTDPVKGVPSMLPDMALVVVTGDITFDARRPLKGTAVLVVKGNVTIDASSNTFFSGMLYVDGNLTMRAPALIRGSVIVRGTLDMKGTGGDYVEVERDNAILSKLMTAMGQYRMSKAPFEPAKNLVDGRPDESWNMRLVGGQ